MAKLHSNRQTTVALVLLFLLAGFALDPPEHRCRTQSTRNRQARVDRLDDADGDHNRWHSHGFDNSGGKSQKDTEAGSSVAPRAVYSFALPSFPAHEVVLPFEAVRASAQPVSSLRGRAPPAFS